MSKKLTPDEIKQVIRLGKEIREILELDCMQFYGDMDDPDGEPLSMPCQTDRLSVLPLMSKYIEINSVSATADKEGDGK